jgi:hypothetical protein
MLPFSQLDRRFQLERPVTDGYTTNEALAYGMEFLGWKLALVSEWFIDNQDVTDSEYRQYLYGTQYRTVLATNRRFNDRNYFHAALSCSREIGENRLLGLRLGAFDYYYRYVYQGNRQEQYYDISDITDEMYLGELSERFDLNETTRRWISPYLQIGYLHDRGAGKSTEAVLSVSYNPVYTREEAFNLDIENYYESVTQTRRRYDYNRDEWIDKKYGDLLSFNLSGRHTFSNGFRLFCGGGFSTASYDADWIYTMRDYSWTISVTDFNTYQSLRGEGDHENIAFFVRGGKTYALERRLDVTVGFSGRFSRTKNKEEPHAALYRGTFSDGLDEEISVSSRACIEMERLYARLTLPLAVEFRPVHYFTCFAGISTTIRWLRDTDEFTALPFLTDDQTKIISAEGPAGAGRGALGTPGNEVTAENTIDDIYSSFDGTIGFSLRYKERLFFDVFTGSDITPDSIRYYNIDIRYIF